MLKENWKLTTCSYTDAELTAVSQEFGVTKGMAKTLMSRGIVALDDFEKLKLEAEGKENPFDLPDMMTCVQRIKKAVDNEEKIVVYGDYDADGVTSTALMYLFLKEKGADVYYHIPDRFTEGYGMNREVITELFHDKITLIITVDNGISAHSEISYAKSLGIDVVVTDHHECLKGIPEDAIGAVNPQRQDFKGEFNGYSGVGVAFMVAMAYESLDKPVDEARSIIYNKYSDIASIGTVADVMSLTGENRAIVKKGLSLIENSKCHKGITALLAAAKGNTNKVTSSTVGFVLGPRINAAGRMSHANEALELFLCEDYEECCQIAKRLCNLNARRQAEEMKILSEACLMIDSSEKYNNSVIVVGSENWNHGVIGIVCSRIVEKYKKPAILFSFDGDDAKGSGRSVSGLNLSQAIDGCSDCIVKYGGHELAAGLTVKRDKLDDFEKAINCWVDDLNFDFSFGTEYIIDAQLCSNEMTLPFAKELELLEPFGQDNPEPLFLLRNARIEDIKSLSQGKHTKYLLTSENISFEALMFNFNSEEEGVLVGDRISIVFTLDVNEYMGRKKVSVNIKDYCFEGEIQSSLCYFDECYNKINTLSPEKLLLIIPSRNECIPIYKRIVSFCGDAEKTIGYRVLVECNDLIKYLKMRIILDIFRDLGLIRIGYFDQYKFKVKICKTDKKVDIEKSDTFRRIQSRSNG